MSFKATPTKSKLETAARALQLVQKTNSWVQSSDLEQSKDSQGKTRSAFCLRGACRAAVAGKTEAALGGGLTRIQDRLVDGTLREIVRTVNKDPARYGGEDESDKVSSALGFNDRSTTEHKHVVRALRDTVDRLASKAARKVDPFSLEPWPNV